MCSGGRPVLRQPRERILRPKDAGKGSLSGGDPTWASGAWRRRCALGSGASGGRPVRPRWRSLLTRGTRSDPCPPETPSGTAGAAAAAGAPCAPARAGAGLPGVPAAPLHNRPAQPPQPTRHGAAASGTRGHFSCATFPPGSGPRAVPLESEDLPLLAPSLSSTLFSQHDGLAPGDSNRSACGGNVVFKGNE